MTGAPPPFTCYCPARATAHRRQPLVCPPHFVFVERPERRSRLSRIMRLLQRAGVVARVRA